jgi:NAD(P)-dependent dehydrogenase (short-subunit alcohol dehydrogenase family)
MVDQTGTVAVVTGANSGIGELAAMELARRGAHVVMGCRTASKGEAAMDRIRASVGPEAKLELGSLDLADLDSVRSFCNALQHERIDLLINNAGVMALPLSRTAQGFEMQFGTNHLGHFALTGLLFDRLEAAASPRIVNVSSQAHRLGKMRWHDLQWTSGYQRWLAYGQSKLANLLFTFEADRRLRARDARMASVACHPGYSNTHLQLAGAEMEGSAVKKLGMSLANAVLAQPPEMGVLPTLYAATHPDVASGDYIGPSGIGELRGTPRPVGSNARSRDPEAGRRLWEVSEELTGVSFLS